MTVHSVAQAAQTAIPLSETDPAGFTNPPASTPANTSLSTAGATQNQFLQLLVTQLKNQDPLNPTNSDQFMSELAQFSQLQELIGVHSDLNTLLSANGVAVPRS